MGPPFFLAKRKKNGTNLFSASIFFKNLIFRRCARYNIAFHFLLIISCLFFKPLWIVCMFLMVVSLFCFCSWHEMYYDFLFLFIDKQKILLWLFKQFTDNTGHYNKTSLLRLLSLHAYTHYNTVCKCKWIKCVLKT